MTATAVSKMVALKEVCYKVYIFFNYQNIEVGIGDKCGIHHNHCQRMASRESARDEA